MPARIVVLLVVLCAVLYVPPATRTPFFTKGEPREGLVVRQMIEGGDWLLPRRQSGGELTIASKPPFFHWLAALASAALGATTELSVRLPSVALGTATVVAVWAVGRTLLPPAAALAGALVLATTFEWVRAVSTARVDATLAALMTAGLLIFWRGFVRGGLSTAEAIAAGVCLAAATLTKGPVGSVLPALVIASALLATGRLRSVHRFRPLLIGAIVLLLAGGWYVAAWQLGAGEFVEKQVLKENVFRFLGASRLKSGHEHPAYYYLPTFAAGFLPWTPLLLAALVATVRDRAARRQPPIAFLLVWFGTVLAFYSAASAKRSVYLLALYPAAALLTGRWWAQVSAAPDGAAWLRGRAATGVVATLAAVVAVPLVVVVLEGVGLAPLTHLAPHLHSKDRANLPIVRDAIDTHFGATALGLVLMLSALALAWHGMRRARGSRVFVGTAAFATVLWALVFGVFQPALARTRTLAPFLAAARARTDERPLYFYRGTFDFGAAFYAPAGMRSWHPDSGRPAYVLLWDDALAKVTAAHSGAQVLATSEGTDPKGARRLVLIYLP